MFEAPRFTTEVETNKYEKTVDRVKFLVDFGTGESEEFESEATSTVRFEDSGKLIRSVKIGARHYDLELTSGNWRINKDEISTADLEYLKKQRSYLS